MGYTLLNKGLLGTKLGMTQIYEDSGDVVPCTLVEASPCTVTQVKKADGRDGYEAIQIGMGERRDKLDCTVFAAGETKAGDTIACTIFSPGDYVDVIGTMKGRGFAGVVKRHGFATMKESHGAHYFWRHAGSIGCRKPEHTRGGTRMAGHLGASRSTCQNLKVVRVDAEKNLLYIRGAIAGPNGGLVMVRIAKKRKAAPPAAPKAAPAA
jgi:large subunit ribosomal protein L3